MTLLRLAAWALLVSALQGCAMQVIRAKAAVHEALESRPDRRLDYRITVRTVDGKRLVFNGSTECPHSVSGAFGRGAYSTKTTYATLEHEGRQWVLAGINCELAIKKNGEGMERLLRLYNPIDEFRTRAYYFHILGSAQVVEAEFESSIQSASAAPVARYSRYGEGPYVYQKVFLDSAPEALRALKRPTVVYAERDVCGRSNSNGLAIDYRTYQRQLRSADITAYEEGRLSLQEKAQTWTASPGVVPIEPFDAVARIGKGVSCIAFNYGGEVHRMSGSAVLYLPDETAFYRISTVARDGIVRRAEDEGWKACAPPGEGPLVPGRIYRSRSDGPYGFVRRESDGSHSCVKRRSWP